MTNENADIWHMRSALNLARTCLGRVWPNPSVGCVIVKEDIVLARARTGDGGRPHAETAALKLAGQDAKGATAYVSLEPCAHQGETGPCAQALIDSDVKRIVVACTDNDQRVDGQGIKMLKTAGLDVTVGVLEKEALELNKGFFLKNSSSRPLVTLKTASTLDAKIATSSGESKWITGEKARGYGHIERAQHDAILVGVNTVIADNPTLTARISGLDHDIIRIVLDTSLKLKGTEQLFDNTDKNPVWIITSKTEGEAKALLDKGAKIITVSQNADGLIDLKAAMAKLSEKGLTRVLVEGGSSVVTSFMKEGLFDRVLWFHSASVLGSNAHNAIQETNITTLNKTIKLHQIERRILDEDMLDIYERA